MNATEKDATAQAAAVAIDLRFLASDPAYLVALGFGAGLSPVMPGTAGTLFAWASFIVLSATWPGLFTPFVWAVLVAGGFIYGISACQKTGVALNSPDHGCMVWDEIVAFWLVLMFVMPADLLTQLAAFLLFRFFDMVKPPPIRYFDQHIKGGIGVMFDDIVAAFFALLVLALWRHFSPF